MMRGRDKFRGKVRGGEKKKLVAEKPIYQYNLKEEYGGVYKTRRIRP